MKAILCADKNWAIGYRNSLLISIPSDMRFFRRMTEGHVVVMGRRTLESMPGGKPLKNRVNIVLTANRAFQAPGAVIVHDLEELQEQLKQYDTNDVFVIGGAKVYEQLLPFCDTVYVTKVNYEYQADAWFPDLDKMPEWEMTEEGEEQTCFNIEFAFCTYKRKEL